jgi:hypothetical protein
MLLANFPHLNGVFGIKGEEKNGNRILVLILIEWRTNATTGVRQPCVTELIDFGPDSLSDIRRGNAETALQLPLPQWLLKPFLQCTVREYSQRRFLRGRGWSAERMQRSSL